MSEKSNDGGKSSTEGVVRIVVDGGKTVKNGNILPTFHVPPPPPPKKK